MHSGCAFLCGEGPEPCYTRHSLPADPLLVFLHQGLDLLFFTAQALDGGVALIDHQAGMAQFEEQIRHSAVIILLRLLIVQFFRALYLFEGMVGGCQVGIKQCPLENSCIAQRGSRSMSLISSCPFS